MRRQLALISLLCAMLAGGISGQPASVITGGSPHKSSELAQDSHLERVRVRQETGFDGKVRSIRFSLEKDEGHTENNVVPADSSHASDARPRRSVDKQPAENAIDEDLQAEEAKVFRPLFVYRQQVARRLKLKNDRKPDGGNRPRVQRTNAYSNRYYDPYAYYQPYRYVPYYPRYNV